MRFTSGEESVTVEIVGGEDLWYLSLLIKPGDRIAAEVMRRVERKDDAIRTKKTERERIRVVLIVETIDFEELSSRLHILGQIIAGPEDYIGEHQSINVEYGSQVTILPKEMGRLVKNLEESSALSSSTVIVLSTDDQNFSLYGVNETRNDLLWRISIGAGKMYVGKENNYRDEFLNKISQFRESDIYILGPSIFRDSTCKLLSQNNFKAINTQIGGSEEEGIRELLQQGIIDLRRSLENKLIADFLRGVNSGLSAYGKREVDTALENRAVATLLISDKFFRSSDSPVYMNKCSAGGCKLFIVHSSWETGKIVESYGGVVAILRFRSFR